MLIGQINNGSLGLKGQQPIENRYVSDITVTLLKWHCTVTHAHRNTPALTHTLSLRLTLMSSGEIYLRGSPQKVVRETEFRSRRGK